MLVHGDAQSEGIARTFLTLHYTAFFIVGSVLAKHKSEIGAWFARLGIAKTSALAVLAVFLYSCSELARPFEPSALYPRQLQDWIAGAGACMFIPLAMNVQGFKAFLHHHTVHYLGRISYSLYLVHGTVLFTLIHFFYGRVDFLKLLPLYVVVTIALADIFYRLIEFPSMTLGRRLTTPAAIIEPS